MIVSFNNCHTKFDLMANNVKVREQNNNLSDTKEIEETEKKPTTMMRRSLSKHDVPQLFHNSHVEFGFRPLHEPWSYYLLSIFSLHNEFMNVWTHLISLILMINKIYVFSEELDFKNDPYTWPLLTGMCCGVMVFLCSTLAHCCHSKSVLVHYIFFMIDYAGIALYSLGSAILNLTYCTEDDHFKMANSYFFPVAVSLPTLICFCCTISKVNTNLNRTKQKMLKILPIAFTYILFNSPIIYRILNCYLFNLNCDKSIHLHLLQVLSFTISGIFFGSDIPQRWCPGRHDIFMHSHQLFHIAVAVCILTNMDSVMMDFKIKETVLRNRPAPTINSLMSPIITVITLEIVCVIYFAWTVQNTITQGKQTSQKVT